MSTNESDEAFGVDAYVFGLKIVFWAYALMIAIRVVGPALGVASAASTAGPYGSDAAEGLAAIVVVVALVLLFVGLFFSTFVYVSAHNVDVVLTTTVGAGEQFSSATSTNPEVTGGVAVTPGLFFPADVASLFYLLPPALLLYAGFREWRIERDLTGAVTKVVVGYGLVALATIVPVAWIFNHVVGPVFASLVSSPLVEASIRLEYPSLIAAHLVVGVLYPLVFGGAGVMAGKLTDDSRRPTNPGGPDRSARQGDWHGQAQRGRGHGQGGHRQQAPPRQDHQRQQGQWQQHQQGQRRRGTHLRQDRQPQRQQDHQHGHRQPQRRQQHPRHEQGRRQGERHRAQRSRSSDDATSGDDVTDERTRDRDRGN